MSELAAKECIPCRGDIPPLTPEEQEKLLEQLSGWVVIDNHHLLKDLSFKNFAEALNYVNKVGEVAETENHHPNISFTWGKAEIQIYTHKIDGLTESDFVLAAKIDQIS